MPKFEIRAAKTRIVIFEIEAPTKEAAETLFEEGKGTEIDAYSAETEILEIDEVPNEQ